MTGSEASDLDRTPRIGESSMVANGEGFSTLFGSFSSTTPDRCITINNEQKDSKNKLNAVQNLSSYRESKQLLDEFRYSQLITTDKSRSKRSD